MTREEILAKVRLAFHESFGTEAALVVAEAIPEQIPGWDSLGHATLVVSLEKVFELTFEIDDLMAMESVAAIVEIVSRKIA
ncbi:MAG: acyl carrier protein [Magnetococcales bacterium]|nr:acyl carrier protein [Magnetococcales bacterium]MBF0156062.1 acyl carrier protein [Magnetococcales bacterium]